MIWFEMLAETALCFVEFIIDMDFQGTKSFKFVTVYLSFSSDIEMTLCQYDNLHCMR
jgi:hypothetical protein